MKEKLANENKQKYLSLSEVLEEKIEAEKKILQLKLKCVN